MAAEFSIQCQLGGHREYLGRKTEQGAAVVVKVFHYTRDFVFLLQIHLVQNEDDFLAPVLNIGEKLPLALCERTVYRSDKEDQIGSRNEIFSNLLVLADNGVSSGRIYD